MATNSGADMADDQTDDRWTVRGVPKAYREKAAEAAQRRKISVGAHLCRALDLADQAERQPLDLILPHHPVADKTADIADGLSDTAARLALTERAIAAAVALASAKGVPRDFRREANARLRDSLPAARVGDVEQPKLLAAPVANGALMESQ